MKCRLLPTTKRFKQLIKEFGEEWQVVSDAKPVQCFDNRMGIKIESMDGRHARWVEPHMVTTDYEDSYRDISGYAECGLRALE